MSPTLLAATLNGATTTVAISGQTGQCAGTSASAELDDNKAAAGHLAPKVKYYDIFNFLNTMQQDGETIYVFYTRLRLMAKHCAFADTYVETK